jgi:hypothetical protein
VLEDSIDASIEVSKKAALKKSPPEASKQNIINHLKKYIKMKKSDEIDVAKSDEIIKNLKECKLL